MESGIRGIWVWIRVGGGTIFRRWDGPLKYFGHEFKNKQQVEQINRGQRIVLSIQQIIYTQNISHGMEENLIYSRRRDDLVPQKPFVSPT